MVMMERPLKSEIYSLVCDKGPMTAKQIADSLDTDKSFRKVIGAILSLARDGKLIRRNGALRKDPCLWDKNPRYFVIRTHRSVVMDDES